MACTIGISRCEQTTRLRALPDFAALAPETARALGAQFGLDYLVTESALDLPLAFESGRLHVYRLR